MTFFGDMDTMCTYMVRDGYVVEHLEISIYGVRIKSHYD